MTPLLQKACVSEEKNQTVFLPEKCSLLYVSLFSDFFFFAMNLYSYNFKNNEAFFFFNFTLPLCFLLSLIGLQGKPLHFRFPW